MWTALIWLLQVASIVGATCATLYLIRRHKPEGLAAVIIAPANIITGVATRLVPDRQPTARHTRRPTRQCSIRWRRSPPRHRGDVHRACFHLGGRNGPVRNP
jgi:hypothetical protein